MWSTLKDWFWSIFTLGLVVLKGLIEYCFPVWRVWWSWRLGMATMLWCWWQIPAVMLWYSCLHQHCDSSSDTDAGAVLMRSVTPWCQCWKRCSDPAMILQRWEWRCHSDARDDTEKLIPAMTPCHQYQQWCHEANASKATILLAVIYYSGNNALMPAVMLILSTDYNTTSLCR